MAKRVKAGRDLIQAAKADDVAGMKLAASAGAGVDARDDTGDTALMYASAFGRMDALRWLLDAGADVEARNNHGITALMDAAMSAEWRCMQALIEAGCELDAADNDGETALMFLVSDGDLDNVDDLNACKKSLSILLEAGCSLDRVGSEDGTAEAYAREMRSMDLASMIAAERERRQLIRSVGESAPRSSSLRV